MWRSPPILQIAEQTRSGPVVRDRHCGHLSGPRRAFLLRAPPLHGRAIRVFIRRANQFWPSAANDRVGETVETPLGILVYGAIVFLWKARFSLTGTKVRRSKSIDQAAARNPIQGRNVQPDTGRHELLVSLTANGNLNKALTKGLQQLLVSGVVAIVARCIASN